jgi:hypothetical protein
MLDSQADKMRSELSTKEYINQHYLELGKWTNDKNETKKIC